MQILLTARFIKRRHGLVAVTIECAGPNCWNSKRVTFDSLQVDDTSTLADITRLRRFQCSRCGWRQVRVCPDWTDHVALGNGRRKS